MSPKRGQPPKPPEEQRTESVSYRYTKGEKALLQEAWELSGSSKTLSRWFAEITLEEAKKIITEHKH